MNPRALTPWLALLLVLATFALVAEVSRTPFERLPHLEDEVAYLYQAKIFARGYVVIDTPAERRAFWQPFVLDYNGRRFGKYTPGWPLLLAIGVALGQPWLINAFLAALAVALTYRLGREIYDPPTGLVAALLTAISPTLLLLSGSLMSHTASLFWSVTLIYALWRLSRRPRGRITQMRWALLGGIALGMLILTRPLTAVGLFLPFALAGTLSVLIPAGRLLSNPHTWGYLRHVLNTGPLIARRIARSSLILWTRAYAGRLRALLIFGVAAGGLALLIPLFNAIATGDPFLNLYTLVWPYDRVGFGPEFGRSGHDLAAGLTTMRFDLGVWSGDLFGWQMPFDVFVRLMNGAGWWLGQGVSWLLLPVGLIAARKQRWTWLLAGVFAGLVIVHLAYWIGAQSYSARYYSEAIPALALISAAGVTALARRINRPLVYAALAIAVLASLIGYTPARLAALWHFNNVGGDRFAALDALRDGRPVLILITGADSRSWRDWGAYMAVTSPFLDSDVIAARSRDNTMLDALLSAFPGRQVLELPPDGVLRPFGG